MKDKSLPPVTQKHRRRLLVLSLVLFFLFSLLVARFFSVQIIEGQNWAKVADRQHYFIVKEPFQRGVFYSNTDIKKGHLEEPQAFVMDVQKFHLYADVLSIPEVNRSDVALALGHILELDETHRKGMEKQFAKNSRSRKLAIWLDKVDYDQIMTWWQPYARKNKIPRNALFFISDYKRSYPYGKLLGPVLHTVQGIKDEKTRQAIPTGGLELYFNQYLTGRQGKRRLMRSPRNSLEIGEVISLPENGADIYLTINLYLQAIAEEEIAQGVMMCKAKSGWAVMMDPKTGEILALAQYPYFYPEDYQKYFNDPKLIEDTKVKAITDAREPGSIMKPITVAIALKANEELAAKGAKPLFDPDAMMPTSNPIFPGRRKPLKDTHFHSHLNMDMAIQKSSNIYCARLVEKIIAQFGSDWYRRALTEDFGFGHKTGIELPSESAGLVPTPGKKHPNGALEWSTATPFSMAMGHNIQVTSLQALRAYSVFANGGYRVEPTLVRKIVKNHSDGSQEVVLDNTNRTMSKKRVISEKITKDVVKAMKYTTKVGGTARRADVWGYTEAGKTGTADKAINGVYDPHFVCASFIGMVPAEDPAFILIVSMDEPAYGYIPGIGRNHLGSNCSAPVFREIAKRSLEYLGIPPDDPHGYPAGDPRYDANKADWLPELRQLQEKYEKWNKGNGGHE